MAAKKRAPARGPTKRPTSKAAFVRSFGLDVAPRAILEASEEQGVGLTITRIYAVRAVMSRRLRVGREHVRQEPARPRSPGDARKVREFRRLVEAMGVERARGILEALERRIERLLGS